MRGLRRWRVIAALLAGLALPVALLLAAPGPSLGAGRAAGARRLRIDFVDVGQGDAALVTSPSGKTVLIDGGPRASAEALTTFLHEHAGRGPLDLVVLTHRHADHLCGLPSAVGALGTRLFLDAPVPHPGPCYAQLMRALDAGGVAARQATHGRTIDLGGGAVMALLGPPEPLIVGSRSDVNANSVVTRLSYGRFAVLFAGDAETPTEKWLLASGGDLRATVLKVAHHGSRYASGARFLRAVGARIAIVSVGAGNEYGHPAGETLARLARTGAAAYRTDLDGDVTIETDGASMTVRTSRGRQETLALP